jgi:hypothetical protein
MLPDTSHADTCHAAKAAECAQGDNCTALLKLSQSQTGNALIRKENNPSAIQRARPTPATTARTRVSTRAKRCSMAGIIGASSLAFGVMSEKRLRDLRSLGAARPNVDGAVWHLAVE